MISSNARFFFISYRYRHFLVILVSSSSAEDHLEWSGLVEAKVRYLITNLEHNVNISLAHVLPRCFDYPMPPSDASATSEQADNESQCSMWFVGLEFQKAENLNVDLTGDIQSFTNAVFNHAVSIR